MSFQGDVAGIGLGELLQGLARGGKDGVLTLYGKGVSSALGVKKGLLHLLESPEEDPDTWRLRAERAWADFPDPNLDHARREAIARAERMEVLFSMLDSASLHFRFEPGALPMPKNHRVRRAAMGLGGSTEDAVWGPGMPVEYVLLEHARISDESASGLDRPEREDVPRPLDAGSKPKELQAFLSQCDGMSSIGEIADRLGWPLRQCRGAINELVQQGALRLAPPRELLALAQRELEAGREDRAASRLCGWLYRSPAGPPGPGDSELLIGEWESGRLGGAFVHMPARAARALLRRLDFVHPVREEAIARWDLLAEQHKNAPATRLRAAAQRLLWRDEVESATTMELLRLARGFQDAGQRRRQVTTLRIALQRPAEQQSTRVELGTRLLDAGLEREGGELLFQVARQLLGSGERERAISVLHTLLKGAPGHREGQGLLLQARAEIHRGKRRKQQTLIGLGLLLVAASVGLVQRRDQQRFERHLAEVTELIHRPGPGLALLQKHFGDDDSPRVAALRGALTQRLRDDETALRERWLEGHERVLREATEGDPVSALAQILERPEPPALTTLANLSWPPLSELFQGLLTRLENDATRIHPSLDAKPEELHAETRLLDLVAELVRQLDERELSPLHQGFAFRLKTLHEGIQGRRSARAKQLEARLAREMEERQDWMLALARSHAQSQQLELALKAYEELGNLDGTQELMPLLSDEIGQVRAQRDAYARAVEFATAGRHSEALREIREAGLDATRLALPWRVDTRPSGATVRLSDGSIRRTPFVVQSSVGTPFELAFELDGTEPRRLLVETPEDLLLSMHRLAERHWSRGHVVQAAPVPVGEDHVVADRSGNLARIRPDGTQVWAMRLETLGGIARTPQFLPARPGILLVLSEDGQSWLVSAADGRVHGTHRVGSPPKDGPVPVRGGLGVLYSDGTMAIWEQGAEPRLAPGGVLVLQDPGRTGPGSADRDPKLTVLRRASGLQPELSNPWNTWRAEILSAEIAVRRTGTDQVFWVRRQGDWSFVAWEAPNALVPEGRLWVADGEGLRSFLPPRER